MRPRAASVLDQIAAIASWHDPSAKQREGGLSTVLAYHRCGAAIRPSSNRTGFQASTDEWSVPEGKIPPPPAAPAGKAAAAARPVLSGDTGAGEHSASAVVGETPLPLDVAQPLGPPPKNKSHLLDNEAELEDLGVVPERSLDALGPADSTESVPVAEPAEAELQQEQAQQAQGEAPSGTDELADPKHDDDLSGDPSREAENQPSGDDKPVDGQGQELNSGHAATEAPGSGEAHSQPPEQSPDAAGQAVGQAGSQAGSQAASEPGRQPGHGDEAARQGRGEKLGGAAADGHDTTKDPKDKVGSEDEGGAGRSAAEREAEEEEEMQAETEAIHEALDRTAGRGVVDRSTAQPAARRRVVNKLEKAAAHLQEARWGIWPSSIQASSDSNVLKEWQKCPRTQQSSILPSGPGMLSSAALAKVVGTTVAATLGAKDRTTHRPRRFRYLAGQPDPRWSWFLSSSE